MSTDRVRATYDAVARDYDAAIGDELAAKPLDRALLDVVLEQAGEGTVADVGCGPGHVTRHLRVRRADVLGVDLSPSMVEVARESDPDGTYVVGSVLDLPVDDDAWAGAVVLYSVIHLADGERPQAWRELARAVRPGGPVLVSFHVRTADVEAGGTTHVTSWFGHEVDVHARFLDPDVVGRELEAAGLEVRARLDRAPADGEFPSHRCSLLARAT